MDKRMRPSGLTANVRIWRPFSNGSVLLADSVRLICTQPATCSIQYSKRAELNHSSMACISTCSQGEETGDGRCTDLGDAVAHGRQQVVAVDQQVAAAVGRAQQALEVVVHAEACKRRQQQSWWAGKAGGLGGGGGSLESRVSAGWL
jgi:hypothetical protein